MHYFTFSSQSPIKRLLSSQLLSAVLLLIGLALPLILRYVLIGDIVPGLTAVLGAFFLVLLTAAMGLFSGGKKLFEVTFFLITYANINKIPFLDYFGGITVNFEKTLMQCIIVVLLSTGTIWIRKWQLARL